MDRRSFIKLTAISGTSAALTSCGSPENTLIRFVPDEDIVPGQAVWKPSVCPSCQSGCGLTVRVMDAEADVVLSLDQETFVELLEGRQNFLTGVLQGRIGADGDLALALRLRGIFPLGRGPSAPSCKKVQP